jgi:hypothetical protein
MLLAAIPALPAPLSLKPMLTVLRSLALGAGRTFALKPAHTGDGINANLFVREVSDCICKGFDFVFHRRTRIAKKSSLVKYVIASVNH